MTFGFAQKLILNHIYNFENIKSHVSCYLFMCFLKSFSVTADCVFVAMLHADSDVASDEAKVRADSQLASHTGHLHRSHTHTSRCAVLEQRPCNEGALIRRHAVSRVWKIWIEAVLVYDTSISSRHPCKRLSTPVSSYSS